MRVFVRILSSLLGIVIAACGAALLVEVAWKWAFPDRGHLFVPWERWRTVLSGVRWDNLYVQLIAGGAVLVGLLFLLFAAGARRRDVPMHEPKDDVSVSTSPRSLARVVGQRVREEDGVDSAAVVATRKRVKVRAASRSQSSGDVQGRVREAARAAVDSLPLAGKPRVSVAVSSQKGGRA